MEEEEALRRILIAYKKLDTTFVNQFEGLTPYNDCNLSNLTNSPVDVPQESFKVDIERVQDIIDQKGGDKDVDLYTPDCKRKQRLALRNKIYSHHNRHEIYISRYGPFTNNSTYGVFEADIKAVAQSLFSLIMLTRKIVER